MAVPAIATIHNGGTQAYTFTANGTPASGILNPNGTIQITGRQAFIGVALTPTPVAEEEVGSIEEADGPPATLVITNKGKVNMYFAANGTPSSGVIAPNRAASITARPNTINIGVSVSNTAVQESDLPEEQEQDAAQ